ncbi:hypothetical protein DIS24_g7587 [Lasiodiplodia hormozganensis]|uniref:Fe2OG dioxygenase domain-containing protein n=1 Tax=Lasiodiplodia hormozganensis TaxID=869390 RepID=A0AA39Y7R8_9PEZI|nr:hypothetical protein DIS24_g7587 [Lasiodiplodia hormozganensis]
MPSLILENAVPAYTPPKVVGPATKRATRPTNKLPQSLIDGARIEKKQSFDPKKHLVFQPPKKIYSMEEIGLGGHGISPNAASEPFPLFNDEAIDQIRAEVFSDAAMENCQYASTFNKNMIRGMGAARAPFTYDIWNSPEVLAKISQVAGIELVPAIQYEIANINVSINDHKGPAPTQQDADDANLSAVAWHFDSFPFVCVTMLSDCTGMVGGETALRLPSGDIMKVRGPSRGYAVVMQGRYIEHQALKALGGQERITMVTAFRPKSPFVKDETILTGSRPISNLSELYGQYTEYKLQVLEERIRDRLKAEHHREVDARPFDIQGTRAFLMEQKRYIESMLEEVYEIED